MERTRDKEKKEKRATAKKVKPKRDGERKHRIEHEIKRGGHKEGKGEERSLG